MENIYHGSINIIRKPIYGYGKVYNDYGLGFYCTYDIELAKEWSVTKEFNGYANKYEIDLNGLRILNLNDKEYCILHWLALLLKNRYFDLNTPLAIEAKNYILDNFLIDVSKYDIVIGYRADDSYFTYAQDFINGSITYNQLKNAMKLGNLGIQIVLVSKLAFERIKFVGYDVVLSEDYFYKKMFRDKTARNSYLNAERFKRKKGDINIVNIIDEEMKGNDSRLR